MRTSWNMRTRILQKQNKITRMTRNRFKVLLFSSQDKKGIPGGQSWISPRPINLSLGNFSDEASSIEENVKERKHLRSPDYFLGHPILFDFNNELKQ